MPESVESSKFVSQRTRESGEFDSRKESHSTKFKRRSRIFVKLSLRELCDSKVYILLIKWSLFIELKMG